MHLSDFDVPFDETLIAEYPISPRDHARLLVVPKNEGPFHHHQVRDLPSLLKPGDVLVLYTDGITEAQNAQEMFFGEKRLQAIVQTNLGRSARDIQDAVIAKVHEFVSGAPQFDDIALMVVARGSTGAET